MTLRPATVAEMSRIMAIVTDAQRFLKESGVDQWQEGYPSPEVFTQDIAKGVCWVATIDGRVAAVISVYFEPEACYASVEDGKWLTGDAPYAVFHRAAVSADYRGMGIAGQMLSFAESLAREQGFKSLRGDTHRNNKPMRALLEKQGYIHCGTIYLDGVKTTKNQRVCYEKLL